MIARPDPDTSLRCGFCNWPLWTAPTPRIAAPSTAAQAVLVSDHLIERAEVIPLLFNVSDIAVTLTKIERHLGEDDGEEEADEG